MSQLGRPGPAGTGALSRRLRVSASPLLYRTPVLSGAARCSTLHVPYKYRGYPHPKAPRPAPFPPAAPRQLPLTGSAAHSAPSPSTAAAGHRTTRSLRPRLLTPSRLTTHGPPPRHRRAAGAPALCQVPRSARPQTAAPLSLHPLRPRPGPTPLVPALWPLDYCIHPARLCCSNYTPAHTPLPAVPSHPLPQSLATLPTRWPLSHPGLCPSPSPLAQARVP